MSLDYNLRSLKCFVQGASTKMVNSDFSLNLFQGSNLTFSGFFLHKNFVFGLFGHFSFTHKVSGFIKYLVSALGLECQCKKDTVQPSLGLRVSAKYLHSVHAFSVL